MHTMHKVSKLSVHPNLEIQKYAKFNGTVCCPKLYHKIISVKASTANRSKGNRRPFCANAGDHFARINVFRDRSRLDWLRLSPFSYWNIQYLPTCAEYSRTRNLRIYLNLAIILEYKLWIMLGIFSKTLLKSADFLYLEYITEHPAAKVFKPLYT